MTVELTLWTVACVAFGGWAGMILTWMWLDRPRRGDPQGGERLPDNVRILPGASAVMRHDEWHDKQLRAPSRLRSSTARL